MIQIKLKKVNLNMCSIKNRLFFHLESAAFGIKKLKSFQ